MKSNFTLLLLITLSVISCTKYATVEEEKSIDNLNDRRFEPGEIDDGTNGDPNVLYEDFLLAGQTIDSGTITVTIVDGNIVVTYTTDENWVIDETHLFVGDLNNLPINGGGNPRIGHFPFAGTHTNGTTEVSYTTLGLIEGECVYVAAHAVVRNTVAGQTETAWGNGEPIGGNSWAMMFEVCY
jgi:hypothetical protein